MHMCYMLQWMCGGQFTGLGDLLLSCGAWGLNSGYVSLLPSLPSKQGLTVCPGWPEMQDLPVSAS